MLAGRACALSVLECTAAEEEAEDAGSTGEGERRERPAVATTSIG